jgi:hypothetical protein
MTGAQRSEFCRGFAHLTLASDHTFAAMTLTVHIYKIFNSNPKVYKVNNRHRYSYQRQVSNLRVISKGVHVYYVEIT